MNTTRYENSLVAYFKDPYKHCCDMDNIETKTYAQKYEERKELNFKVFLTAYDKRKITKLQIANTKTEIDMFFEDKHRACKHQKRTLWELLKLQLSRIF